MLVERSRFLLTIFSLSLVLVLGCLAAGCRDKGDDDDSAGDDDDSADSEVDRATPVRVARVERGSVDRTIPSSATIESESRADVVIEARGTVDQIRVEEGQLVSVGTVLAVLDNPEMRGELEKAEAAFRRSKEGFDAVDALFKQGFVSRNEYEEASLGFDTARLTVEQARDAHASLKLTSPIEGTVSLRALRFGELASPGRLVFQVVDLSRLKLEVNLPEKDLAEVKVGQEVRVYSEVLEGVEAGGRVQRISPVVSPESGTVKVTVGIGAEASILRPGMFVHVDVVVDTREAVLLLPKKAVLYEQGEPLAFVVEEGKAVRRKLELGYSNRDFIEARTGLAEGEQLVVIGQGLLREGVKVRVVRDVPAPSVQVGSANDEVSSDTSL